MRINLFTIAALVSTLGIVMEVGPRRGLQSKLESLHALRENLKESWEEYDTQRAKTRLSHALVRGAAGKLYL